MKYLLIAGSRSFNDRETFEAVVSEYMGHAEDEYIIVEGGAKGADSLAKEFGHKHCEAVEEFRADWERYGRAAGHKRNDKMVAYIKEKGGKALYFWDGESKGTKQCIASAKKNGIAVTVFNTTTNEFMSE